MSVRRKQPRNDTEQGVRNNTGPAKLPLSSTFHFRLRRRRDVPTLQQQAGEQFALSVVLFPVRGAGLADRT